MAGKDRDLRLAVTAPRSVELEQDILVVINDKLLVATAYNHSDWTLLGLGNRLRLDAGLNLAINDVLDEFANFLSVNLLGLIVGVLGVLGGILDSESGENLRLQVKVAGVSTKELGVEGNNVDLSAVLGSDRAEFLSELIALLFGFRENIGQGNTGLI
jgi:hypothetical protein